MKHLTTIFTILLVFALGNSSFAQTTGNVSGEVNDDSRTHLQSATVSLLSAKDSSLVKISVTDVSGRYVFSNLPAGKYRVSVSAIGYKNSASNEFSITENDATISLPVIELKKESKSLQEVTVVAQKPLIEVKADKTVLNIAGSINAVGSTALELLQKSPGVRVDKDDNISMNGKNGVRVYIDGKPSQMDGKDLAAVLKGMPSSDIESIEIITNPSAKYDASGNAGIINIKLKKNKSLGFNGNAALTTSFGKTPKLNGSTGLNYRNKFVNLFGNYSYFTGNYANRLDIYREQSNKGTINSYDQRTFMTDFNDNHNYKIGADFFLSKKSTLGVLVNGNHIDAPWESSSSTVISSQANVPDSVLLATNRIEQKRKNYNYNINYRFTDTSGRELNIDADHGTFESRSNSFQPNVYMNAKGTVILNKKEYRNITPSDIIINSLKADYEQRLWGGKLGFGGKTSFVKTDNSFLFYNVIDGRDEVDTNLTNQFIYKENVNAAYVNFNKQFKKWSFQAGVRAEQTHAKGDLIALKGESGQKVDTSYLNFFPSAGVTFTLNKNNSLGVTYSRRIDRPSYQDLNPFEYKLDELTFQKGNPFLKPQYTDNIQLVHTFKQFLTTSIGYSHIRDFFTQVTDTADGTKTFVTNKNISAQNIYSINISAPLRIKEWWNGYVSLNAYYSEFKGELNGSTLDVHGASMSLYMEQSFTLSKTWSTQVSGFYHAPGVEGTIRSNAMGSIDWGIQKKLFEDKATVKLSVTDVFNTMKWGGNVNFGGLYMKLTNKWESQQAKISFTYRFGNKNVKTARERNTGLDEEQKRIKSGR